LTQIKSGAEVLAHLATVENSESQTMLDIAVDKVGKIIILARELHQPSGRGAAEMVALVEGLNDDEKVNVVALCGSKATHLRPRSGKRLSKRPGPKHRSPPPITSWVRPIWRIIWKRAGRAGDIGLGSRG